jgi:hypothetical protein
MMDPEESSAQQEALFPTGYNDPMGSRQADGADHSMAM